MAVLKIAYSKQSCTQTSSVTYMQASSFVIHFIGNVACASAVLWLN